MPKDEREQPSEDIQKAEREAKFDYELLKTRCTNKLGIAELTFNRMVTDLTLNLIPCWVNRLEAAKKIRGLAEEAFKAGQKAR